MGKILLFGLFLSSVCFGASKNAITGKGVIDGTYMIVMMDQRFVESILEPELKLNPTVPGVYPVVFMLGKQIDVSFTGFPGGRSRPMYYSEFAMTIPNVSFRSDESDSPKMYNFMPRLFLNDLRAIRIGINAYGYAKKREKFASNARYYRMGLKRENILNAHFIFNAQPVKVSEWPVFQVMLPAFSTPFVGKKPSGEFICSSFEYDFENARVQPQSVELAISNPFFEGMPATTYLATPLSEANPMGAFHLKAAWSLAAPQKCN